MVTNLLFFCQITVIAVAILLKWLKWQHLLKHFEAQVFALAVRSVVFRLQLLGSCLSAGGHERVVRWRCFLCCSY